MPRALGQRVRERLLGEDGGAGGRALGDALAVGGVAGAPKNVWCTQSVCVLHIRPRLAMSISFCARVAGSGRICVALGVQPTRSWRDCKALTSEETQLRSCSLPSTREVRMPGSIFWCGRIGREIE